MVGGRDRAGAEALGSADDRTGRGPTVAGHPKGPRPVPVACHAGRILSPEWEYRHYSFNASWGPAQELASMRNGTGDDYAIVFSPALGSGSLITSPR
jgi:hypothetical protein